MSWSTIVPIDENGMVIDELQKLIENLQNSFPNDRPKEKPYNAMVYIIPTFQNPTGRCLSEGNMRCLLIVNILSDIHIF